MDSLPNRTTHFVPAKRNTRAHMQTQLQKPMRKDFAVWRIHQFASQWLRSTHSRVFSLETWGNLTSLQSEARQKTPHSQSGFALIAVVLFAPLLLTLFLGVAAVAWTLQRHTLAQSLCLSHVSQLQSQLAIELNELLKLNPKASRLQSERAQAERALNAALLSKIPQLIAAAQAYRAAVIAQQIALKIQQQKYLANSRLLRSSFARRLESHLSRHGIFNFYTRFLAPLGLAVRPLPAASLSPVYQLLEPFEVVQSQSVRFSFDPWPRFWPFKSDHANLHRLGCSASLKKGKSWQLKILAVNAS